MGIIFAGCSSTEEIIDNTKPETKVKTHLVFNNVSKNPDMAKYVERNKTRLTATDNTLATDGAFDYSWDTGDTLYVIKSDGSKAKITAKSSGTTVPFAGDTDLSFSQGESVVLLTPTTNSTFSGTTANYEIFNGTGKLTDAVNRNPLFGTTTVKSVTTADNQTTVTINDATCNALFSIICLYIKSGTDAPNYIAASVMANDTIFPTRVSLNLSNNNGTLTNGGKLLYYVRGTMGATDGYFPTITNSGGQHLSKIYLCVAPGVKLQTMKVSAFQADKAYYKKGIAFSSEITFEKAKYYQVAADFSGLTEAGTTADEGIVDAFTKPGMPYSLSPGLLHAYRSSTSDAWNYEYYKDQGYIKGYAAQTPLSAEYFCWGQPDPMAVTHYTFANWTGTDAPTSSDKDNNSYSTTRTLVNAPSLYTALPTLNSNVPGSTNQTYSGLGYGLTALTTEGYGIDPARMPDHGFFGSPNTTEANYLLKGLETANYWCVYKFQSTTYDQPLTWGFYLGTGTNPDPNGQDRFNHVFIPLTGDLSWKTNYLIKKWVGVKYNDGTSTTGYLYPVGTQEMFDCDTNGYKASYTDESGTERTNILMPFAQFSSWTRQPSPRNPSYTNNDAAWRYLFERKSDNSIEAHCTDDNGREIGYARTIRGVAH
jgi:hypothetical protein